MPRWSMSSAIASGVLLSMMTWETTSTMSCSESMRTERSFSERPLPNNLLKRYRPTTERSYFSAVKSEPINSCAFSAVASVPSRRRRYTSIYDSSAVRAVSLSMASRKLAAALAFRAKSFSISASLFPREKMRRSENTGNFRFLSMCTESEPSASDSISIHAPREGMIFAPKNFFSLSICSVKETPNERVSWETITRS